jgi:peptide deformylase
MAILDILEFPDRRLRTVARPVDKVDAAVRQLIEDLLETMYAAPGIGLAATQVNVHRRVVVMDISEEHTQPLVFVNPEVRILEGGTREFTEGCLSVPGFHEPVLRPENIVVTALDREGEPFELRPDGLLAVCIQHELDHLNGKLFVDYLSNLKRQRIRGKLEKLHRQPA